MNKKHHGIPVFKSEDTDALAKAMAGLTAAGIPFRTFETGAGSYRPPRRACWLVVATQDENAARQAIAHIPTELILPGQYAPPSANDRAIILIQLSGLVFTLIVLVIIALLNK